MVLVFTCGLCFHLDRPPSLHWATLRHHSLMGFLLPTRSTFQLPCEIAKLWLPPGETSVLLFVLPDPCSHVGCSVSFLSWWNDENASYPSTPIKWKPAFVIEDTFLANMAWFCKCSKGTYPTMTLEILCEDKRIIWKYPFAIKTIASTSWNLRDGHQGFRVDNCIMFSPGNFA